MLSSPEEKGRGKPERMTAAEFRSLQKSEKPRKYRNKPVVIDGIRFDSKAEGNYYLALKDREAKGEVGGVELQKRFPILGPKGELVCTYVADFAFWDHREDRFRIVDVKGVETKEFKLKRKMMRAFNGIEIEVVK
jgi:hypothetical protein